jgi:urea carboxylase
MTGGKATMQNRYSFGADEHVFVEVDEAMSLEAFFKSLSTTNAVREAGIRGVTEICPANASFQVKFDPDLISPDDMLAELKRIEAAAEKADHRLRTRIIEIPVFFRDPWTTETLMRFRERHQDPKSTDIEFAARINGYASVDDFIAAFTGSPWFVSMVGFVAGLPFLYQMVERGRQIEVPKYLRPRTDTPKLTVGFGGCFGCIYSVRGAGGYQMFGITPMPIYDPNQEISYLRDFMVFFRPGDIVKWKPIDRPAYDEAVAEVEAGKFAPRIVEVDFDLDEFHRDIDGTNKKLLERLNAH